MNKEVVFRCVVVVCLVAYLCVWDYPEAAHQHYLGMMREMQEECLQDSKWCNTTETRKCRRQEDAGCAECCAHAEHCSDLRSNAKIVAREYRPMTGLLSMVFDKTPRHKETCLEVSEGAARLGQLHVDTSVTVGYAVCWICLILTYLYNVFFPGDRLLAESMLHRRRHQQLKALYKKYTDVLLFKNSPQRRQLTDSRARQLSDRSRTLERDMLGYLEDFVEVQSPASLTVLREELRRNPLEPRPLESSWMLVPVIMGVRFLYSYGFGIILAGATAVATNICLHLTMNAFEPIKGGWQNLVQHKEELMLPLFLLVISLSFLPVFLSRLLGWTLCVWTMDHDEFDRPLSHFPRPDLFRKLFLTLLVFTMFVIPGYVWATRGYGVDEFLIVLLGTCGWHAVGWFGLLALAEVMKVADAQPMWVVSTLVAVLAAIVPFVVWVRIPTTLGSHQMLLLYIIVALATFFRRVPWDWSRWCYTLFLMLVSLGVIALMAGTVHLPETAEQDPQKVNLAAKPFQHFTTMFFGKAEDADLPERFPVCRHRWHDLDIVDLALMSELSYYVDGEKYLGSKEAFTERFQMWFNHTDFYARKLHMPTREAKVLYYDLYSPSKNLSIITVRGSATKWDFAEDIDLYSEPALLQLASLIVPFNFVTERVAAWYIHHLSKVETMFHYNHDHYYKNLHEYVSQIAQDKDTTILIVGHSLGGATAKIVAVKTKQSAVSFSGPGIILSHKKFGIRRRDAIEDHVVNVIPRRDIVPMVDLQGGMVQYIPCKKDTFSCHDIVNTKRTLLAGCHGVHLTDKEAAEAHPRMKPEGTRRKGE